MGDKSGALTVNYSIGGTADSGDDFTAVSGTVVFAAGEVNADVEIEALHDGEYDPGETVTLTVGSGTGYTVGGQDEAEITIDDDAAHTFELDSIDGAVWYDIDWSEWDAEDEDPQQLPLMDFAIEFAGQHFTEANATITGALAEIEDGELTNIEFTVIFDNLVSGYKKLVVDVGAITGFDATNQQVGDEAELAEKAAPTLIFDFSTMQFAPNDITWTLSGQIKNGDTLEGIGEDEITVPQNGTPGQIREAMKTALEGLGLMAVSVGDTMLKVSAPEGKKLVNIKVLANVATLPAGPSAAGVKGSGAIKPYFLYEKP